MNPIPLTLRRETPEDAAAVETLTREAFWNQFAPGCSEHYLVRRLRESPDFLPELDYVAVAEGRLVGSILYAKAHIALDRGGTLPVIGFGPLSVLPADQGRGVGSRLVGHTLELARQAGYAAILIYGDPAYYSRLGFVPAEQYGIGAPDGFYRAALQAYELQPGALAKANGLLIESPVYDMDPTESEAFDAQFPYKTKLEGTASQRRFQDILAMCKPRA